MKDGPRFRKSNHPLDIMVSCFSSDTANACTNISYSLCVGPVWSTGDADPSCDQQPAAAQVVSIWVVALSTQPAYLHHFPSVSHSLCCSCASSSIKHMYVP